MAVAEFINIPMQMLAAHIMIDAIIASFKQRPETLSFLLAI